MTKIHLVYGAKGGVGTTTVTAAAAITYSRHPQPLQTETDVLVIDATGTGDIARVLGVSQAYHDEIIDITETLSFVITNDPIDTVKAHLRSYSLIVVDCGTCRSGFDVAEVTRSFNCKRTAMLKSIDFTLVARNEYLSLSHAVSVGKGFDRIIILKEPDRSLDSIDVAAIVPDGVPVVTVPVQASVARSIDAGLLITRLPRTMQTDWVA